METKHTPGPWIVGKPNQDTFYVLTENQHIGMLPTREKHSEANAKLIAAAPELLEAAMRLYEDASDRGETHDPDSGEPYEDWKALEEAIKKATS